MSLDAEELSRTRAELAANLARVLPAGSLARIDRASWTPPAVFTLLGELGRVPRSDLERTLNMGIGFVAVVAPDSVSSALAVCRARGIPAWVLGEVGDDDARAHVGGEVTRGAKGVDGGAVALVGEHPSPG